MNIIWIIGHVCSIFMFLFLFLFIIDNNKKRERIWIGISGILFISYIVLFTIRMSQILTQLQNGN